MLTGYPPTERPPGGAQLAGFDATVFVLDDEPGIISSTTCLLESNGARVRAFTDADQFFSAVNESSEPACCLLDMRMPGMDGLSVQQRLLQVAPHLVVVIMTGRATYSNCAEAMRLGAVDIIQKPFESRMFIEQMIGYLNEATRRWEDCKQKLNFRDRFDTLTSREREVYSLMLGGNQTKQLAFQLDISVSTAEKHVRNVLRKFRVDTPVRLILASVNHGELVEEATVGGAPT